MTAKCIFIYHSSCSFLKWALGHSGVVVWATAMGQMYDRVLIMQWIFKVDSSFKNDIVKFRQMSKPQ